MRIAVLPPAPNQPSTAVENFFQLYAIKSLLGEHTLVRIQDGAADWLKTAPDLYLCLGNRFLEDGPWDECLLGKPARCMALGLSLDPAFQWSARTTEKMRAFSKNGGVSVVDETTQKKVREVLSSSAISLGGNPALYCQTPAMVLTQSNRLVSPHTSDTAFAGKSAQVFRRLFRRFYSRFNHKGRALFLTYSPEEFEMGALPGRNTFFEPRHPFLHLKAIASSSGVVGFHPTVLFAATACGVPAVLIGNDPVAKNAVEDAGIPFLEINTNTDPGELEHRAEEILRKYPWETYQDKSGRLREGLFRHLKDQGLRPREPKRRNRIRSTGVEVLHVACAVGSRDTASFIGLFENLQEVSQSEVRLHALALDKATEVWLQKTFNGRNVFVYRPSEIWEQTEITPLLGTHWQQRFLLKPRFLSMLVKKIGAPVVYSESTIFHYASPSELFRSLEDGHTLLFPQWSDATPLSPVSVFGSSLFVVAPGSEGLLSWWSSMALETVKHRPRMSVEAEPPFLALAPVLFPGVRVYRAADQNITQQAVKSLGLGFAEWEGEPLILGDGRFVQSIHAEGRDEQGFYAIKNGWDQIAHFASGQPAPLGSDPFQASLLHQQKTYWGDLERFLRVHRFFNDCFPWFRHAPRAWELKFFVARWGRYLIRLAYSMVRAGRVSKPPKTQSLSPWAAELRKWIFLPLRSNLDTENLEAVPRRA